jgi:hypothetical protein
VSARATAFGLPNEPRNVSGMFPELAQSPSLLRTVVPTLQSTHGRRACRTESDFVIGLDGEFGRLHLRTATLRVGS